MSDVNGYSGARWSGEVPRYGLLIAIAVVQLLPIVWMMISSFRPADEIFRHTSEISWRTFFPTTVTFDNYLALLSGDFPVAVRNSLIVAGATVAIGVVVNSLAGFAFAVFEFPFKRTLFVLVLASFMMPFEALVIPLYTLVRALGWTDSFKALILPEVANGLVIFLFRQFFAAIPREIIEAARMDGASWLQIYWRIAMPLSGATVATAALMIFILQWDAFFWPLVAASSPDYVVVQVAIARNADFEQANWGQMFAATTMAVSVALIPFILFQRFYVRTLTQSGLK